MLGERANEGEGTGYVVVGHHKRRIEAVMDIIFDRAQFLHDPLIGPSFERSAQIDADQLPQDAGVDAFEIIGGNRGHCRCFPSRENRELRVGRSPFDGAAGHSFDEAALHDEEENDRGHYDDDRRGHDLSPVTRVLAAERVEPHDCGLRVVALQEGG